ncbi:unnamed protein product [Callosobruchus maculatus]|uniref:LKB1 serine/threonine kinase interacting protein 1 N-terminal domain-containing protein n=1 Tax=Callosobruchus maculatus TaxID=64391 RepID=A0A653DPZ5_CALMS|nr:unnamed protein product [Callosobruchus maculatus]
METSINQLANHLKKVARDVISGKQKLCLSTSYLKKINTAVDDNLDANASFHTIQSNKSAVLRDVQFLLDLVEQTVYLKLIPDTTSSLEIIDIRRFKKLKVLETCKVNIELIVGIQKLRPQLQELICIHSLKSVGDILEKCGADHSSRYNWSELKKAKFCHNDLEEIDDIFEYTISLNMLDLSHNKLKNVKIVNQLPNLKHLTLAYNGLESAPQISGHVRNRLQVLILNNNYIEDITALTAANNLIYLDLSNNLLVDHNCLLSISHLISLQSLYLRGNPLAYHPHHRTLTCNYLHKNTATVRFLLDGIALSKTEQCLVGSLYPIFKSQTPQPQEDNEMETSTTSIQQSRKARNVKIMEENVTKKVTPISTPPLSAQHLEIKRQVEQLKEEYGEKWLYSDAGLLVQDVLGFEKSSILLSSTPSDGTLHGSLINTDTTGNITTYGTPNSTLNGMNVKDTFRSVTEESPDASSIVKESQPGSSVVSDEPYEPTSEVSNPEDPVSDASDGEDIFSGGEEGIFLATNTQELHQVFVVLTESHISERDVTTSKEKARWHVNTIVSCTKPDDTENVIRIEFDTLRRDRKQRIYELEEADFSNFYDTVMQKISEQKQDEKKSYQCMKCSETFSVKTIKAVFVEQSVTCPKCNSNLVFEST